MAAVATANEATIYSCTIKLPNTVEATSCSNFPIENLKQRLAMSGLCLFAGGKLVKQECPTENLDAVCIVEDTVLVPGQLNESFYYNFSSEEELNREKVECEKDLKGTFTIY